MAKEKKSDPAKPDIAPAAGSEESTFITVGDGVNETTSIMKWGAIIVLIILVVGMVYAARTTGAIDWFTSSSRKSSGTDSRQVVQETTYPTEKNPVAVTVGADPVTLPEVPGDKKIRLRSDSGSSLQYRDKDWPNWVSVEGGTTNMTKQGRIYIPEVRSTSDQTIKVEWYYVNR